VNARARFAHESLVVTSANPDQNGVMTLRPTIASALASHGAQQKEEGMRTKDASNPDHLIDSDFLDSTAHWEHRGEEIRALA